MEFPKKIQNPLISLHPNGEGGRGMRSCCPTTSQILWPPGFGFFLRRFLYGLDYSNILFMIGWAVFEILAGFWPIIQILPIMVPYVIWSYPYHIKNTWIKIMIALYPQNHRIWRTEPLSWNFALAYMCTGKNIFHFGENWISTKYSLLSTFSRLSAN